MAEVKGDLGWVAWQVTAIFENIGVVQEGMMSIARPIALIDQPEAQPLVVTRGAITFEGVRFHYGGTISASEEGRSHPHALLEGFSLTVRPGEKIGLVGRSGAGKSTVVNLLLRFFDLEGGRVLIDGQDIAAVTQGRDFDRAEATNEDPAVREYFMRHPCGHRRATCRSAGGTRD